jgi:hypothetical protein
MVRIPVNQISLHTVTEKYDIVFSTQNSFNMVFVNVTEYQNNW